jgi:hypothetical protein
MELNQDFSGFFNSNSSGAAATPAATPATPAPAAPSSGGLNQDFSSFFQQGSANQNPASNPATGRKIDSATLDNILTQENATALHPLVSAFMGQESSGGSNAKTSVDNAHGAMQILPATAVPYMKPGERLDDTNNNIAIGTRILADYAKRFNNDPAKIAVAYFSGPGNVATSGATPWKQDKADGNGTTVSQYVKGILGRLGNQPAVAPQPAPEVQPQAPAAPDLSQAPKWSAVVANPDFQKLDAKGQQATADAYFQKWIAPNVSPDQMSAAQSQWAQKSADVMKNAQPSTWQNIKNGATNALNALNQGTTPDAQDGVVGPTVAAQTTQATPPEQTAGVLGNGKNLPQSQNLPPMPFVTPQFRDQVFNQYDAATPAQRAQMVKEQTIGGQVAQYRAAQYAANQNPASADIGTSVEDRTARLVANGVAPDVAAAQAQREAASGQPTVTPNYMKSTDFDFDTAARFRNGNPFVRGVAQGVVGVGQAAVGLGRFEADMLGTDVPGAMLDKAAKSLSNTSAAIGQSANPFTRNLEGAVSGVTQLAPALLGGALVEGMDLAPLAQNALQMFGQSYSEGRDAGQTPGEATVRAGMMGAFAVLGHAFGLDAKLDAIRKSVAGASTDDLGQVIWQSMIRDLPSTQAMALGNFVTDKLPGGIGLAPDAKFTDWLHSAGDMFVQTAMMNGMLGAGLAGNAGLARTLRGESKPTFDEDGGVITDKHGNRWNVEPAAQSSGLGAPGTSANQPHASSVAADNVVREMAKDAGMDPDALVAKPTPVPPAPQAPQNMGDGRVEPTMPTAAPTFHADDWVTDANGTTRLSPEAQARYEAWANKSTVDTASPVGATAAHAQQVMEFAAQRWDALHAKQAGSIETVMSPSGQEDVSVAGAQLTPAERMEWETLNRFKNDPAALAHFYGFDGAQNEPSAPSAADVDAAAHQAATSPKNDLPEPTQAQKEAGNYQKGHVEIHGLDVSIENPQGSKRSGVDPDGVVWENTLQDHYGYIKRTVGADEEHIDTFVGPNPASRKVFIVDQTDPATGKFDEHKVMLGYDSVADADAAYHRNYADGWNGRAAISELPIGMFKEWLEKGDTKAPFARELTPSTRVIAKPKTEKEAKAARENAPAQDTVRMYHGGEPGDTTGPLWFSSSERYARDWGSRDGRKSRVWYVDLPHDHPSLFSEYPEQHASRGYTTNRELPAEDSSRRKLLPGEPAQPYGAEDPLGEVAQPPVAKPKTEREAQQARKLKEQTDGSSTEAQSRADAREAQEGTAPGPVASTQGDAAPAASGRSTGTDDGAGRSPAAGRDAAGTGRGVQPGADGSGRGADAGNVTPASAARDAVLGMVKSATTERDKKAHRALADYITKAEGGDADAIARVTKAARALVYDDIKPTLDAFVRSVKPAEPKPITVTKAGEGAHAIVIDPSAMRGTPKTEEAPRAEAQPEQEAPKRDSSYGAGNKTFTADAAAKARETLRKKLGQLNAGLDPEMMHAGLMLAGFHIEAGARKFADFAKAMVEDIGENIRPYLRGFYENVRHYPGFDNHGMTPGHELDSGKAEEPAQKVAEKTQEVARDAAPKSLVDHFYSELTAGRLPKDNAELRKAVATFDGKPADNARLKQAQEDLEAAIAHRARDIVAQGKDERATFETLVGLYNDQPNLNIRTSTSIENQAYSTPAPLAYVAAKLAGIDHDTKVYEPTAGNGMLLLTADPKNVTANELEDQRFGNLKAQGFDAIQGDALQAVESGAVPVDSQDAVITNPPFGSLKDDAGKATKVSFDGFKIGKIDHLIAAEALRTLKDDGKATLIIGADKVAGGLSTDDRIFFNWLYGNYNVTSHFEVDGKLYSRQGAAWPVRVITLDGREKSKQVSPRAGSIARVDNWNDVYEQFRNGLDAQKPDERVAEGRTDSAGKPAAVDDAKPADVAAGKQAAGNDRRGSEGSARGAGDVAGKRAGSVDDQRAKPDEGLADTDRAQRRDDTPVESDRLDARSEAGSEPAEAGNDGSARAAGNDRVNNDPDNQFQAKYIPRSGRKDEGVLIPVNMAGPTQDALNRLEDQVGNIDKFAARELGYDSVEQLHDALMGLQVDSVASAIHQISRGKGTIIADQTGIGKGRQAASVIRWAAKNGHIPVFITVKPQLFTDMHGDLADIGTHDVAPFIMNSDAWISGPGGNKLFANKPSQHRKNIDAIAATGELPEGSNAVFLTYSQINTENRQRAALMALAHRAIFVLDESHNAGGASATGEFVKGALDGARGAVYLSATYAKRPDNMPVYFKTDIGDAIGDDEQLLNAMTAGGLPLQTVVANNLVKAGQMFRRERSYDGVSIETQTDTARRAEHEKLSDHVTEALRAIVDADKAFHEGHVANMKKDAEQQGAAIHDIAGNQASSSVNHTEFSSVVHNFVRQMLLGLKADAAADKAIEALKANKKPLIAVENTMGSFLAEYADNNGIKVGDPLGKFDYRTVLSRALERTRYVIVQKPNGDKEKVYVPIEALDGGTRRAYADAQAVIDKLKLDIPVSPIDWMRHRLEKAGYSVAEITGRNLAVDYSGAKPALGQIAPEEQTDKVGTTRRFNAGSLDALVLNVAGSTGISLHASEKFKDQRQRHMVVAQPAQDINIFMQMLGRIHRTGQVVLPEYSILNVDLPAEKRPTALLSKKMKSLNANTSSNTESATSIKAPDMLNKYGDQVITQYLLDNDELRRRLGIDALPDDGSAVDDIARKATGRLALMPVETQHAFYNEVQAQYESLIDYLNRTNQNELEPRTFDYDAKETRAELLHQGDNPETPFGEDAYYGEYSIKAQGKPMTPDEIRAEATENLGGQTPQAHADALVAKLRTEFEAGVKRDRERNGLGATFDEEKYRKALKATKVNDETAERMVEEQKRNYQQHGMPAEFDASAAGAMGATADRATSFIKDHRIGTFWRVEINGELYNAVVTDLKSTHKESGNPFSMSKLQVSLALNGSLRHVTLPATQFGKIEVSSLSGRADDLFRVRPGNERETAKIVTGNLLAAYGEMQGSSGTIINFTKSDGTTEQGILLPKKFNFESNVRGDYRLRTGADALKFLQASQDENIARFGIASRDGVVRVRPQGRDITIQVPKSKAKGGKYFLDRALLDQTGDFVSSSKWMEATVRGERAEKALDVLMNKSALYALPSMAEEARTILNDPKPAAPTEAKKPGEHFDLQDMSGLARDSALATTPEPVRTSALTTLRRLNKKLEAGEMTDAEFRLATQNLLWKLENKRDGQVERKLARDDRERGELYVRERLLRAARQGDISRDSVDFAQWLLDQNPAIADDLGFSVRTPGMDQSGTAGMYSSIARVVRLFKGSTNETTAVHEILHHTERMMPEDVRHAIYKAWSRDWQEAYKRATPEQKAAFGDMLASSLGSQSAWARVAKAFRDGVLNYDDHYKLVNPSEYWAVKATDILKDRFDAKRTGWVARAKQWLSELVEKAKGLFGMASDSPILRGLKDVLKGDATLKTDTMMSEKAPMADISKSASDAADERFKKVADTLLDKNKSVKTFGWWDKTLGTQLHKALKDEHYGRVFDTARKLHNTVALAAVRPAEHAPNVVPPTANFRQNVKKLFAGARQTEQMRRATQALLDGTLSGDNVMQGKIWSDRHLEEKYGLTEEGKRVYQQTRDAVDASLDEVAASEAWGMAQGFVPKEMRELIIDKPSAAQRLIRESLDAKINMLTKALDAAVTKGETERASGLQAMLTPYEETREKVEDIFERAEMLKSGGYLPLMRFGKYSVYAYHIDPETGMREVDPETDQPMTAYFGLFPTEAEARFEAERQAMLYKDDPSVQIQRGVKSEKAHQLYEGLSPETLALFADKVGADEAMKTVIQLAMSERSALKRRLERQGIAGFSQDLPRILSNFLTSNARFAGQRYYMRDLNRAITDIPQAKGDVIDEAIALKKYMFNGGAAGNNVTAAMFAWYLAGSPVSAATIITEMPLKTIPFLAQHGISRAIAAVAKAMPYALGKKEIKDPEYRAAVQRATREGIVKSQEIFHLYELGSQNVATWLSSQLSRLPLIKDPVARSAEGLRTRFTAFMTLAGMMHSVAEAFNRRMAFHAAWHVAKSLGVADPYQFAANATDETSGIYAKYNRPNVSRTLTGRVLMAFKHWEVTYLELIARMIKRGGPQAARVLGMLLLMQTSAAGVQGLPFMQNLDDVVDTIGNLMGYNTDFARFKRELAEGALGHKWGDVLMHGLTRLGPIDMSSHLEMGRLIPGTDIGKLSNARDKMKSVADAIGPAAGIISQLGDAYDAATSGSMARTLMALAPTAPKHIAQGVQMMGSGQSVDFKGRKIADASPIDAASRMIGGRSPEVAQNQELRTEINQAVSATKVKQAQVLNMWARGLAQNDPEAVDKARANMQDWNEKNPDTKVIITPGALQDAVRQMRLDANTRTLVDSPKAMKGAVSNALHSGEGH